MRIEIEFSFTGKNHFRLINRYCYDLGRGVVGFSLRIRPLFIVFKIRDFR
jgi:hypothetical protein